MVPFSHTVNKAGAAIAFLKLAIKYREGKKVSRKRIKRIQIKAKMKNYQWKSRAVKNYTWI